MPDAETFDYANMQKLLAGDLGQLSSGQKLMALGALLRSAGRGSKTTPQEVLGQLRGEAQKKAVMQLQLAQMQAASAEKQKVAQLREDLATRSPELASQIRNMPDKQIIEIAGKDIETQMSGPLSAVGKEYADRVRLQGKAAADTWLRTEGLKLIPVTAGGAVYSAGDFVAQQDPRGPEVRRGVDANGRRVVEYANGDREYAD